MKIATIIACFILGALTSIVAGWLVLPKLLLNEHQSPYSVEETVEKIIQNAKAEDWNITSIQSLHQSVEKQKAGKLRPVMLINLCQANHAYNILKEDKNKIVSVMMPCTISVYQKSDGKTYIGTMNAGLLGIIFGGTVAKVMGGIVADHQQKFIDFTT